jgi:hypothetical protein
LHIKSGHAPMVTETGPGRADSQAGYSGYAVAICRRC